MAHVSYVGRYLARTINSMASIIGPMKTLCTVCCILHSRVQALDPT